MVHIRYSRWNARSSDSLDSDSVFDQLNDYMNDTGDLQQAMRRLMQKGMKQGEKQNKGLEDLLSQVAREMRKLYDEYRLQSAIDEVQQQLESVVEQEQETLQEMDQSGNDVQDKKQFLNDLPGKTSEAIEKLTSYRFENSQAEKEFQQLVMQLDQIRKLENWLRREGSLFRGQTPMQFQQSQELMERMEDLRKLESQLSSMQLKDVDKELLERLLGGDPKQDFEGVMRMQSLLEEGGYVLEQGDRFELTPKGVRRVGHLALRDIYRQLRRDGMGRHATRNRGTHELVLETSRPYVVDELGRAFCCRQESRVGDGELGSFASPARLFWHRRIFYPCR
jgi:uncharacterized protein with von Willebrand factor type A (vWA) domain